MAEKPGGFDRDSLNIFCNKRRERLLWDIGSVRLT